MYQFRKDTVAVRQQLLGTAAYETQIICLRCAKAAAQQGLAHLFQGQLTQSEITTHQLCPGCGSIIGEIVIQPPMNIAEYQALRVKLATIDPEDLVNLLSLTLEGRPDTKALNENNPYDAAELRYTPHPCTCNLPECTGHKPGERVFHLTINEQPPDLPTVRVAATVGNPARWGEPGQGGLLCLDCIGKQEVIAEFNQDDLEPGETCWSCGALLGRPRPDGVRLIQGKLPKN